jgi:hypothetical protein
MSSLPKFKYIVLKASDNKAKYGTVDFTDQRFIYDSRVRAETPEIVLLKTTDNLTSTDNENATIKHLVQSHTYNKFEVFFVASELVDFTTFQSSNLVELIDENDNIYKIKECEITEKKDNNGGKEVLLTCTILSDDEFAVTDFVSDAYLTEKFSNKFYKCAYISLGNLTNIEGSDIDFKGGTNLFYFTKFKIITDRSEADVQFITLDNGSKKMVNVKDAETYTLILYLTEEEKAELKKYMNRCTKILIQNINSGTAINIYEPLEIEFEEAGELINLYKTTITAKTNVMNTYNDFAEASGDEDFGEEGGGDV